jgi:hypothetical protein
MESWGSILRGVRPNAFKISLEDVRVFALSETTGLVTCVEVVEADDSKGRWGVAEPAARLQVQLHASRSHLALLLLHGELFAA